MRGSLLLMAYTLSVLWQVFFRAPVTLPIQLYCVRHWGVTPLALQPSFINFLRIVKWPPIV